MVALTNKINPIQPVSEGADKDWVELLQNRIAAHFETYYASDQRNVSRLAIKSITKDLGHGESFSDIRSIEPTYVDSTGKPVGKSRSPHAIEFRKQQDVVDLVAYTRAPSGELKIGIVQCVRGPVAARHAISEGLLKEESGVEWNLPGAYMRRLNGLFSPNGTINSILVDKLGVPVSENTKYTPIQTGGAYLPSAGGSTESCQMWAVEVQAEHAKSYVKYEEKFECYRRVDWVSPQEIVDRTLSGEYKDLRLILAAFRLAHMQGQSIKVDPKYADANTFLPEQLKGLDLVNLENVNQWINDIAPGMPDSVTTKEIVKSKVESKFLESYIVEVQPLNDAGNAVGEPFSAEVVTRRGFDSVATSGHCYVNINGKPELMLLVVQNIRPALAARESVDHPIGCRFNPRRIEGVAESLEGEDDLESIGNRAKMGLNEEGGIEADGEAEYLFEVYPSPGTNVEKKYFYTTPIRPDLASDAEHTIDEAIKRGLMRPADIIQLAEQGVINEPSLEVMAYIMESARKQQEKEVLIKFNQLMASGSIMEAQLAKHAPSINSALHAVSKVYRILKRVAEEKQGVIVWEPENPIERQIFDNFVSYFMVGATPSAASNAPRQTGLMAFDLLHDLFHYQSGGVVPFERNSDGNFKRDQDGKLVPKPYVDYRKAMVDLECAAVWFSDVYLPEILGFEKAREVFGQETVGEALAALGYTGRAAFDMVFEIQSTGRIPDSLISHPDFHTYKHVLVDRLVRLYYRDDYEQSCNLYKMYQNWHANPFAAEIAAKFSKKVISKPLQAFEYYEKIQELTKKVPEGNNPLRASIARSMNFDFRRTALNLAFYRDIIRGNEQNTHSSAQIIEQINETIDRLYSTYTELEEYRHNIKDTNPSPYNLEAFSFHQKVIEDVVRPALELESYIRQAEELIGAEKVSAFEGRILPCLSPLDFDLTPEANAAFLKERARYEAN